MSCSGQDHGAEEPLAVGRAPLVEQVVVVGLEAREPELVVLHVQVEAVAGEAGVVREAELAPHPVDVHVLDAFDGVVATGPDLVEAGGARAPAGSPPRRSPGSGRHEPIGM